MAPRKPAAAPADPPVRRSARLAAPIETSQDKNRVSKKTPAPKPKPQKFECNTCARTLAASSFPKHLATDKCNHSITTCKSCSKAWIAAQLESTTYDKVSCPECPELVANAGVRALAAKDVYEKFDRMERRGIAEKTPGWRWCMNTKCRAGQVHQPLLEAAAKSGEEKGEVTSVTDGREPMAKATRSSKRNKRKMSTVDEEIVALEAFEEEYDVLEQRMMDLTNGNFKRTKSKNTTREADIMDLTDDDPKWTKTKMTIRAKEIIDLTEEVNPSTICTCNECGAKACVPCDKPYHDGETCAEAQERYKRQTGEEEEATKKLIEKECKQCPKCKKNIQKSVGCDHMICTQCRTQFCWVCVVDYAVIRKSGHGPQCVYSRPGAIDPHHMPNDMVFGGAMPNAAALQNGGGALAAGAAGPLGLIQMAVQGAVARFQFGGHHGHQGNPAHQA